MRRSFLAAAVALPLVVLVLGIVRSEQHLVHGRRWTFEIAGYDPRDLLRGQYIQFRLVLGDTDLPMAGAGDGTNCDDDTGEVCCLCLFPGTYGEPAVFERTTCEIAREQCEGAMPVRYLGELQRYYIAEGRAEELTKIFQEASQNHGAHLVVAIDSTGKPQIDKLLIYGVPVEEAAETPREMMAPMADDDSAAQPGEPTAPADDAAAPLAPPTPAN